MRLKDVELGPEDGSTPEQFGDAVLVARVDHVDLEKGLVADVVAVEIDALAQDDESDELGRALLLVAAALVRERERHGVVERRTEASDVVVHCW